MGAVVGTAKLLTAVTEGRCWRLDVSSAHRPAVPHIGVKRLIVVTNSPGAISGKRTLRRHRCCDRRREIVLTAAGKLRFLQRPLTSWDLFMVGARYVYCLIAQLGCDASPIPRFALKRRGNCRPGQSRVIQPNHP